MSPTYRRHPMDKRRPVPHRAPRAYRDIVVMVGDRPAVVARAPSSDGRTDPIYTQAARAALGPDPRQEHHS